MKCQSKIGVSMANPLGGVDHILIKGNMYECELTPTLYDPNTLQPTGPFYIVRCEDGKFRKYAAEHFRDIVEWREIQLNELGI